MNIITQTEIESIDIEGKGIARLDGKTVFVPGALPNEKIEIEIYKKKPSFDLGRIINILEPSKDRITPPCPNFGICGGCSLQHFKFEAQITAKEKVLLDNFKHIGKVIPRNLLTPLKGPSWEYRHRARLSVRYVEKKGGTLVGFREKNSSYVADMNECLILPKHISDLLPKLRSLLNNLSIKTRVPQIELALGEKVNVLVFRIMEPLSANDEVLIKDFVDNNLIINNPLQIWLQPKGPDSCYPFYPLNLPNLNYQLPNFNIDIPFYPTEFTQVNPQINNQMVTQAVTLLEIETTDIIYDFFCGIGNFTLPIATKAQQVIGIEGSEQLVKRAISNANHNNLTKKVEFKVADLFKVDSAWFDQLGKPAKKWLIDPPRDGAIELVKAITPRNAPVKIVYISCNPATLARDAAVLVNVHGYKLIKAGVMNMFPHTSHIESIAVFEKN